MQESVDSSELPKTSMFDCLFNAPEHKVLSQDCFSFPIRSLPRVYTTRWFEQPPSQEQQDETVRAMSVSPHRQDSQHEPLHRHPRGFTSGVACSGQEQRGDTGWSAAQVLVLSRRHYLMMRHPEVQQLFVCDVPTVTAPSQESRKSHGD